jgi:hypothetical protein
MFVASVSADVSACWLIRHRIWDACPEGRFDPRNFRHRRALDESEPLDDPELEHWRQIVVSHRRLGDRAWAAPALRRFAQLIEGG